MPAYTFGFRWKATPSAMSATLGASPSPSRMMSSGMSPTQGTVRRRAEGLPQGEEQDRSDGAAQPPGDGGTAAGAAVGSEGLGIG